MSCFAFATISSSIDLRVFNLIVDFFIAFTTSKFYKYFQKAIGNSRCINRYVTGRDMSKREDCFDFELEEESEAQMRSEEVTNAYFLLDLDLPSPKKDAGSVQKTLTNTNTSVTVSKLHKFGFLELLEKIHGKDLRTNNPWMNPSASKINWKARTKKRVRFSTTEISGKRAELPYCRKKGDPVMKPGQLHATSCRNASQETVEVLGDHVWQNRVFILDAYIRNAQHSYSRSRENSDSEGDDGEGYYKAGAESLQELGVFDSVELAKQRLAGLSGREDIQDVSAEQPSTSNHQHTQSPPLLLHPNSANLELDLGSPFSDEECPTTASTLKHLSDQAYTDSPDNVFDWPQHSSSDTRPASQTGSSSSGQGLEAAFQSTENQFKFEMFEPPKLTKHLSHSDYGSEEADEHSDEDLAALLNELPKLSPLKMSPDRTGTSHTQQITVRVEPPTPSYRTGGQMGAAESARLRGTVKVSEISPTAGEQSGIARVSEVGRDSQIQQLTEFMFDSPSPDD